MNGMDERFWPVQHPTADFAERTVAAMLASRGGAPLRLRRPNPWLGLSLAALLAAGSALGWGFQRRSWTTSKSGVARVLPKQSPISLRHHVPPLLMPKGPSIAAPTAPTRTKRVAAPPTVRQPTSNPHAPKVPACQCERGFSDTICDCY